jgi:serine protease Do
LLLAILLACSWTTARAQDAAKLPDLVEKVRGGVVTVEVINTSKTGEKSGPIHGSGFIISNDGYVVSSTSQLEDAASFTVILASSKRLPARLVGTDLFSRVALLKVESSSPLTALAFADSDRVRQGDPTFLVGDVLGLPQSVTSGVISAKDRAQMTAPYEFLQTDAAVSDSSGGAPLFNFNGEVIGMVFSVVGEKTDYTRAALAVPANLIKRVVPKLQLSGTVARGWLGVQIEQVSEDVARSVGLGEQRGVKVLKVFDNSPAGAAGLTVGDVILQIADAKMMRPLDLVRTTSELPPGAAVDITVWREGAERKLQAKLITKPADATPAAQPPTAPPPGKKSESVAPAPGASPQSSYEQFTDLARQQAEKAGAAKPPWIDRAEVLRVGIYTSTPIKVIKDPSLATNQRLEPTR